MRKIANSRKSNSCGKKSQRILLVLFVVITFVGFLRRLMFSLEPHGVRHDSVLVGICNALGVIPVIMWAKCHAMGRRQKLAGTLVAFSFFLISILHFSPMSFSSILNLTAALVFLLASILFCFDLWFSRVKKAIQN